MTSGICQFSSVGLNLLINLVLSCPQGYFRIGFMSRCRPWLTCRDLSDIQVGRLIGSGAVKAVFVARWRDMNMAHNELINDDYADDFLHGIQVLQKLPQSDRVARVVGSCPEKYILLTDFYQLGVLRHLTQASQNDNNPLELCFNFLLILRDLHSHVDGPWVLCDVTSSNKIETQFLLNDAAIPFVLNDVDSLANASFGGIKCGNRRFERSDEFVAPEVVNRNYFDEKIDICEVPAICKHFISKHLGTNTFNTN